MSWLSDLADRAETLLNKIDQNAAAVLQEKDKKSISPSIEIAKDNSSEKAIPSTNINVDEVVKNNISSENHILKSSQKRANFDKRVKNKKTYSKDILIDELPINSSNIEIDNLSSISTNQNDLIPPPDIQIENNAARDLSPLLQNTTVDSIENNDVETILDVEKEMLKNEISVVNNELSLLLSKMKNAEKTTDSTQTRLMQMENLYKQILIENEQLRSKISSGANSMHNMEDPSFESHEETIKILRQEKQVLQDRIKELDSSLLSNSSVQHKLEEELKTSQDTSMELEEKLEKSRNETSNILSEWKNYKIRVNNTLHLKEKMIEDLGGNKDYEESASINSLNSQISQLKVERNEVTQELTDLQTEYSNKIREIEHLEQRLKTADKQNSILKEALRLEKSAKEIAEHNSNSLSKELKTLHSETAKQISALRIKFKEPKFCESDKQTSETICMSSTSFSTAESGDERIRSLTQALVAKQAVLESVTADRNNLRLQLEKTENKYRSDLISMRNNQPRIINVNDTDDVKARFPSLLQESPWDSSLSRRVKKAYSSLDTFSVRVGVFLRRNPVARIFILSYMLILHFWVLIVLCTYTPEAHSK